MSLQFYLLAEDQIGCCLFRAFTERLSLLRTVDAVEADTFSAVGVQDFDRVAVEAGRDNLSNSAKARLWVRRCFGYYRLHV